MKKQIECESLRLMVFKSALELGEKVDHLLLNKYGYDSSEYTFMIPIKEPFFKDGHLKVEIEETVRGKDLFVLTDIGNYSLTYNMHGFTNHASPNDLIMQLKDGIGACNSHAKHINIVMPYLYAGRQHKRITRENLTCGMVLREFDENPNIKSFITFDAHDSRVEHAMPNTEFDNFFATNTILEKFIHEVDLETLKDLVFIAPDNGAIGRRDVLLNSFASEYIERDAGSFFKQRDYNRFENGKYPIIGHDYCGKERLDGKTAIISDDMIDSGNSIFDSIDQAKQRNVKDIYIMATYTLFTNGIEKFKEYYKQGKFQGIYTTNLSYIPEEYQQEEWLHVCDCSSLVSDIIYNIHNDVSISQILRDKSSPVKLLEKKFQTEQK